MANIKVGSGSVKLASKFVVIRFIMFSDNIFLVNKALKALYNSHAGSGICNDISLYEEGRDK